uniref:Bifunctional lysine-specific demethylase and histidyl-hydroxylase n=1 Tax=Pseudo-nitzschia australis TaxID=44445 RepID=A0A7S4AIK6_9STRA|mmetsp:Transcript_7480/g.16103  ORF Transcript_7480/g.16103 Transcript_7480/m.16103 type:complete len:909 (+) Transcript_7480:91-2817(+)
MVIKYRYITKKKKKTTTATATRDLLPVIFVLFFFLLTENGTHLGYNKNNNDNTRCTFLVGAFSLNLLSSPSPSSFSRSCSPSLRVEPPPGAIVSWNLLQSTDRRSIHCSSNINSNIILSHHPSSTNTDAVCYSDLVDLISGANYMDSETKSRLLESLNDRFIDESESPACESTPTAKKKNNNVNTKEEEKCEREQTPKQQQILEPKNAMGSTGSSVVPTIEGLWTDSGDRFRATGAWQTTPLLMRGAFLDDLALDATSEEYPFPTWDEIVALSCNGGGTDYDGDYDDDDDDCDGGNDDDDDYPYGESLGLWNDDEDVGGDYDDDDNEDDGEDYYMWEDEEENDTDAAPSRIIQYSWPSRKGNDGIDSDYYHADVNTNWLDTFEIKQFGPFSDPSSAEGLLRMEDGSVDNGNDDTKGNTIARTLLVNDVDRWHPKLSDWMDRRFNSNSSKGSVLPARWRRDDAQISLSYPAGGIGPHVDNYDVFLIQVAGERTWDILWHNGSSNDNNSNDDKGSESHDETSSVGKISVRDETDCILPESSRNGVRIMNVTKLQSFEQQRLGKVRTKLTRLHLRPGDCLYLPPRVLHCGTALKGLRGECMTLSVGCRAPSALELLDGLSNLMKKAAATRTPNEKTATRTTSAFPSNASLQSFHQRYTNTEIDRGEMSDGGSHRRDDVSKRPYSSKSSWLSPKVKNEMKDLVLDAVRIALDDDENVLDPLVGKFVTRSNRLEEEEFGSYDGSSLPSFSYPKPLRTYTEDEMDTWTNPTTVLVEIFGVPKTNEGSNNTFLRRAEGIAFVWSSVYDKERRIQKYRLYAQGRPPFEVLEESSDAVVDEESKILAQPGFSTPDSKVGHLMERIANGPPLNRAFVLDELNIHIDIEEKETKNSMTWLLHELVAEGLLYGGYCEPIE